MDRQRNDRLGWFLLWFCPQLLEHRREILRAIWSYTYANSQYNSDADADSHLNANSYTKNDSNT
jgi:hypothetical protein